MGHINKTPAGSFRANWRDPSGRKKAKTFPTKKEAAAYLAEIESTINRGSYIDPAASKTTFGVQAEAWLASRNTEKTSAARDASYMRTHVLPQWRNYPLGKVTHSMAQRWVAGLSASLAPASVIKCCHLASAVFGSAVRDRLISANPFDDVDLPALRRSAELDQVITMPDLLTKLLPAIPERYRALVALAGGAGLRWGELVGLFADALDLDAATVSVVRTAVEVGGTVSMKSYPKSQAGRRVVPLPGFVVELVRDHLAAFPLGARGEVFTGPSLGPLYRGTFRVYTWRPSLVRAGLLGPVTQLDDRRWAASWRDGSDRPHSESVTTKEAAQLLVARRAGSSLRFHDLRHSYATWLVSKGVPINDVAKVLGHGSITTTLNRYTHVIPRTDERVLSAFADFSPTLKEE